MRSILSFSLILITASTLLAVSPEEVAEQYFDALKKEQWDEVAGFFHPDALGQFREMMSFINELPPEAEAAIAPLFGEGVSAEDLAKMSDKEFFTSIFRNMMSQVQAMGSVEFKAFDVIGSIPENDDRHVLARTTASVSGIDMDKMEVLSLSPMGEDNWGLKLQGEMKGMAEQMKMMFAMMQHMQAQEMPMGFEEMEADLAPVEEQAEE